MLPSGTDRIARSRELWARSTQVIVGGGQGHKRFEYLFEYGMPAFTARAEGARFWDVDGHEYVDYLMGYGPIVLGHAYPRLNEAIVRQLADGTIYTTEHPLVIEAAEKLVEIIPFAEMVWFVVGGSSATAGAIRIARAHTQREKILRCGYHGWLDWCLPGAPGVPACQQELILPFEYGKLEQVQELFQRHGEQVAAVIMEPVVGGADPFAFVPAVAALAREHGALFIVDEIKAGMRYGLAGAHPWIGVEPDLATYGKAVCNGYPGSFIAGPRDIMADKTDLHIAATFHADALSLVALLVTIDEMQRRDGIEYLWAIGMRLIEGINAVLTEHGLEGRLRGHGPMPCPAFPSEEETWRRKWAGKVAERGAYFPLHPWFASLSHTEEDIEATIAMAAEAAEELRREGVPLRTPPAEA